MAKLTSLWLARGQAEAKNHGTSAEKRVDGFFCIFSVHFIFYSYNVTMICIHSLCLSFFLNFLHWFVYMGLCAQDGKWSFLLWARSRSALCIDKWIIAVIVHVPNFHICRCTLTKCRQTHRATLWSSHWLFAGLPEGADSVIVGWNDGASRDRRNRAGR